MNTIEDLYTFVDLAKTNRKYPESVANNLKSAIKIFERDLNDAELKALRLIETNFDSIFRTVVAHNKNKNIGSLNTYKARFLKVIGDYKRYGMDPAKIERWEVKTRISLPAGGQAHQSTGLLIKKDKQDKEKIILSENPHTPVNNVHKLELALKSGLTASIIIPKKIDKEDMVVIKSVLDSLAEN